MYTQSNNRAPIQHKVAERTRKFSNQTSRDLPTDLLDCILDEVKEVRVRDRLGRVLWTWADHVYGTMGQKHLAVGIMGVARMVDMGLIDLGCAFKTICKVSMMVKKKHKDGLWLCQTVANACGAGVEEGEWASEEKVKEEREEWETLGCDSFRAKTERVVNGLVKLSSEDTVSVWVEAMTFGAEEIVDRGWVHSFEASLLHRGHKDLYRPKWWAELKDRLIY
tara:strand:+ start:1831 stop:2496 length:666 start_codon:yes stop_codon:yes gene_type:complete